MTQIETLTKRFFEIQNLIPEFESKCSPEIIQASELIINCIKAGGKILLCGNGGSAADSQHFAAELVSAFSREL